MSNQVLTATQFGLLAKMEELLVSMNNENASFHELVNDVEMFSGNLVDMNGELSRIDIFNYIKRYNNGDLKEVASIGISNNSGVVIIEAESDYVFGYMPIGEEKHFFLSEVEYKVDEDAEDEEDSESYPMFTIGDDGIELNLNFAMRI